LSFQERHTHTSTLIQDFIITFGGYLGGSNYSNDVSVYHIKTNTWQQLVPSGKPPRPRQRHSACLYKDNKIYIFGGYNEKVFDDIAELSINIANNSNALSR